MNEKVEVNPYASVEAWCGGETVMRPIQLMGLTYPFQKDYVDVNFMGHDDDRREVITTIPNEKQRSGGSCAIPIFTTAALKATLEVDDPENFEILKANLTNDQWEQLALAAELSESYPWGGAIQPTIWDFKLLTKHQNPKVSAWGKEMYYRFGNSSPTNSSAFHIYLEESGKLTLKLRCRDFIQYLHNCSAIVDVLTPLCEWNNKLMELLASSGFEKIGQFYESMRPGADLYRTLPDAAIKPFIEIGNALCLLEGIDKEALLRLDELVSDIGFKLDDNPAHMENDEDGKIEKWWEWTEPYFDYNVHHGLTPMTRLEVLQLYTEHLGKACRAFNPEIEDNIEVLNRLDQGYARKQLEFVWLPQVTDKGPIIKDIQRVYADLVTTRAFFEKALEQCNAEKTGFDLPTRLTHFSKPMPNFAEVGWKPKPIETEEQICQKINSILGEALAAGKKITVTGEEDHLHHHFHGAYVSDFAGEITITYGTKRTKVIKNGTYGAGISKILARGLMHILIEGGTYFQCRDTDDEPLEIQIK